jgi:hypothetical protein
LPNVRPANISGKAFSTLSEQNASAGNSSVSVFSGKALPLPLHPPAGVALASQFSFQLSPKEALASLQSFSASSGKSSTVLNNDTFIDLQEWVSSSVWKLSAAGVPAEAHAALLAPKLFGPIQKLLIRDLQVAPVQLTTVSVSDMCFCREHLAEDIAKFRTYALHSHFSSSLGKNEWIYAQLCEKMATMLVVGSN